MGLITNVLLGVSNGGKETTPAKDGGHEESKSILLERESIFCIRLEVSGERSIDCRSSSSVCVAESLELGRVENS